MTPYDSSTGKKSLWGRLRRNYLELAEIVCHLAIHFIFSATSNHTPVLLGDLATDGFGSHPLEVYEENGYPFVTPATLNLPNCTFYGSNLPTCTRQREYLSPLLTYIVELTTYFSRILPRTYSAPTGFSVIHETPVFKFELCTSRSDI